MNDECSINLSFSVHDNVTWQITMNYDKIIVGSRIEVPCAIRVLEVLKVFSYRFEDAELNERGLTSGKCGELSLEGVFQNGGQNTLKWHYGPLEGP